MTRITYCIAKGRTIYDSCINEKKKREKKSLKKVKNFQNSPSSNPF